MKAYRLGLYEKAMPPELPLAEKLRITGDMGYDFLEISIDETDEKLARLDLSSGKRREMEREIRQEGIPIRTMCLSGHRRYPLGSRDEAVRRRGMDMMEKAVGLAADLNIRLIQLAGYDVYYEESGPDTAALFEENLETAVGIAAREGVMLGFETMETAFMDTTEKAMAYVSRIRSPFLQVYPDCGNLTNASMLYQTDVADDLRKGAGHIAALHLKETLPDRYREVPYGEGHVDFRRILPVARSIGVGMFVTEFWYGGSGWKEEVHSACRMFRELLDSIAP